MTVRIEPVTDEFLQAHSTHRRLETYFHKGCKCVVPGCERVGTHIKYWYSAYDWKKYGDSGLGLHKDLIGYDPDGTEFLMTVDHILPRGHGGRDDISNKQPMCEMHNSKKADKKIKTPEL
jgi:hypothetical protein